MTVYRALEHVFEVHCSHAGLQAHLESVLSSLVSCRTQPTSYTEYEIRIDRDGGSRLLCDGTEVVGEVKPSRAVARLLHHINTRAIDTSQRWSLLHAAAAEAPSGGIVVFPAAMEAGKSTLATGLARAGWRYVTDEVVAIDPVDRRVQPYPRAISLDPGSWHLFPELRPDAPPDVLALLPEQWQVPPAVFGDFVRTPSPVSAIVTHGYDPTRATELVEQDPVVSLHRALGCCFSLARHTERDLLVLAAVVEDARCYELRVGDLDEACELLGRAF